jgi:hypothetical protein
MLVRYFKYTTSTDAFFAEISTMFEQFIVHREYSLDLCKQGIQKFVRRQITPQYRQQTKKQLDEIAKNVFQTFKGFGPAAVIMMNDDREPPPGTDNRPAADASVDAVERAARAEAAEAINYFANRNDNEMIESFEVDVVPAPRQQRQPEREETQLLLQELVEAGQPSKSSSPARDAQPTDELSAMIKQFVSVTEAALSSKANNDTSSSSSSSHSTDERNDILKGTLDALRQMQDRVQAQESRDDQRQMATVEALKEVAKASHSQLSALTTDTTSELSKFMELAKHLFEQKNAAMSNAVAFLRDVAESIHRQHEASQLLQLQSQRTLEQSQQRQDALLQIMSTNSASQLQIAQAQTANQQQQQQQTLQLCQAMIGAQTPVQNVLLQTNLQTNLLHQNVQNNNTNNNQSIQDNRSVVQHAITPQDVPSENVNQPRIMQAALGASTPRPAPRRLTNRTPLQYLPSPPPTPATDDEPAGQPAAKAHLSEQQRVGERKRQRHGGTEADDTASASNDNSPPPGSPQDSA